MSLEDRAKTAAKKVEGKAGETAGDLIDDHEAQAKGKAQQADGDVHNTVEDGKDNVKKTVD